MERYRCCLLTFLTSWSYVIKQISVEGLPFSLPLSGLVEMTRRDEYPFSWRKHIWVGWIYRIVGTSACIIQEHTKPKDAPSTWFPLRDFMMALGPYSPAPCVWPLVRIYHFAAHPASCHSTHRLTTHFTSKSIPFHKQETLQPKQRQYWRYEIADECTLLVSDHAELKEAQ